MGRWGYGGAQAVYVAFPRKGYLSGSASYEEDRYISVNSLTVWVPNASKVK